MPSIASFWGRFPALVLALAIVAPAAAQEPDRIVRELAFEGNTALLDQTLANAIATTNSSWFARAVPFRWFGLGEKRYFSEQEFRADVLRLEALYKQVGYPDVQVDTTVRRTQENVYITFRIREGRPIRVTSFEAISTDSSLYLLPAWLRNLAVRDLPLEQGGVFNRFAMTTSEDSIAARLQDRGYPEARVYPSFDWNKAEYTASVRLDVETGPRAVINQVRVVGNERVDTSVVHRLLVARPGRRFSTGEMFESQRNLFRSGLFRNASIGIDSAAYQAGGDSVPLLVRVSESPPRRIRGSLGFATNDCFRGSLGWTSRNFLGGGRVLDLSSRVSKLGVGQPADWGLADGICSGLTEDGEVELGSRLLNYGLTGSIRRLGFLSPYNNVAFSIYTARRSEFKVYLRRESGMSVTLTREAARRRIPLSLSYTVAYGRTEATAANFCAYFNACTPEVLGPLQQNRVLATLTATAAIPRVDNVLDPTCCSLKSLEVVHSSRFIGSSELQQFTRVIADAAWYRPLARRVVASWRLRGGAIFAPRLDLAAQSGAFVPPEHRFYAGGPNDVRGFERNELGPVVYVVPKTHVDSVTADSIDPGAVRVSATGGNTLAVTNAELRFPSPVFGSRLRLAAFVDAGMLWQRQGSSPPPQLRVTPGFGVRVETPLGPARLDVAYNPYKLQRGALFQVDNTDGSLAPVPGRTSYQLDRDRDFTLHFAVGQPF